MYHRLIKKTRETAAIGNQVEELVEGSLKNALDFLHQLQKAEKNGYGKVYPFDHICPSYKLLAIQLGLVETKEHPHFHSPYFATTRRGRGIHQALVNQGYYSKFI